MHTNIHNCTFGKMKFSLLMFGLVTRSCKLRSIFRNGFKVYGLRSPSLLTLSSGISTTNAEVVANVELERIIRQAVAW